ncbi:GNAT family N-acetyltransferase [Bacillus sp. AFS041924]|uniref:GNAT family N-acetyltransferase n=1 Tax=Bacillus sp. AFS041924 TaxID=2033503 RepID=UPI000BFC5CCF|nr:GNAT family N-acetyltransferase [Bacillus sp. AFS041924]PGS51291.1 GNAT family N-acetyltransferase [Bacillus sp. AFS041924]
MGITFATKEDVKEIVTIYNDAILNTTATFDTKIKTEEDMLMWFNNHSEMYPVIVSKENGVVTGYCSLTQFKEKDAYKHTVELSVYIHPEHRRKGLAKTLMLEMIEIAKILGHYTIISCITSGNEVSEKLHEKLGYKKVGHFYKVGQKFNQWLDIVYYQLML